VCACLCFSTSVTTHVRGVYTHAQVHTYVCVCTHANGVTDIIHPFSFLVVSLTLMVPADSNGDLDTSTCSAHESGIHLVALDDASADHDLPNRLSESGQNVWSVWNVFVPEFLLVSANKYSMVD